MAGEAAAAASLWRFSLMLYSRPGVADALIRLQDERGHNVNLILFGLWLGLCEGVRLDTEALARAQATIAPLDRDLVQKLRGLRRQLKDQPRPRHKRPAPPHPGAGNRRRAPRPGPPRRHRSAR